MRLYQNAAAAQLEHDLATAGVQVAPPVAKGISPKVLEAIVDGTRGLIQRKLAPLLERLDTYAHRADQYEEHLARLEVRIAELERDR